jgi:outer membrane protein assembly factor BamA
LEVTSSTQRLIRTDSHYVLIKNELRFPIHGEHGGVVFYDGGMVRVTGVDMGRPYRDSVGVGYRYNTPVGPFSLDLGFKINPEKDEEAYRVHFSWGYF